MRYAKVFLSVLLTLAVLASCILPAAAGTVGGSTTGGSQKPSAKIGDDPNAGPPSAPTKVMSLMQASVTQQTYSIEENNGVYTYTQVVDENSPSTYYIRPKNGGGFGIYSSEYQDYGWMHDFTEWGKPGLVIQSATLRIKAWDVDSEVWHGLDGEYDGVSVDGQLLDPGYLQGTDDSWSETIFDIPVNAISDDGVINVFLDIDMNTKGWLTTLDFSELKIVYSIDTSGRPNQRPYKPVLKLTPAGGVDDTDNLIVDVTGPVPADPDGDKVNYIYRWFVDTGNGYFVDDEFAGRGNHTGNKVPEADTQLGDIWKVRVTPVDERYAVGQYEEITFGKICAHIQFSSAVYSINEDDASRAAVITITRTGVKNTVVSAVYATSDGSATKDSDYSGVTDTVIFNEGETSKTFVIPIIDDSISEGNETVNIALSNPSSGSAPSYAYRYSLASVSSVSYGEAVLGNPASAVLTIVDKAITSLELDKYQYELPVGGTHNTVVTALYSDETTANVTLDSTYTSNPSGIVSIGTTGIVTGTGVGTTVVRAVYGGVYREATVTVYSAGGGGGGGGGSSDSTPDTTNLPANGLIDRMPGYVSLSAPQKVVNALSEVTLSYSKSTLISNPGHEARIYYWHTTARKWVALATYQAGDGKVKAINAGRYTGWFAVFGVVQPSFTDIDGHWAEPVANRMNGLGMLEGYEEKEGDMVRTAKLEQNVTRAEYTTFIFRMLNIDPDNKKLQKPALNDARQTLSKFADSGSILDWSACEIAAAVGNKLIDGREGSFQPAEPITRLEAAVLTSRALKLLGKFKAADVAKFKDLADIPEWARGELAEGVLEGYPDGTLKPNSYLTRAEAITLLHRLMVNGLGW